MGRKSEITSAKLAKLIAAQPASLRRMIAIFMGKMAREEKEKWLWEFQLFLEQKECWKPLLKPVFITKSLVIDAIDSDFESRLDEPTEKTPMESYQVIGDADFKKVCDFLNASPSELCINLSQITLFKKKYKDVLQRYDQAGKICVSCFRKVAPGKFFLSEFDPWKLPIDINSIETPLSLYGFLRSRLLIVPARLPKQKKA
jgi:hypothetical protein